MKNINVGVVGIGHLGNYHLQKYAKIENVNIAGVSDILEESAVKAAELYKCPVYTDYREMIGHVDAVSIAVPTIHHHRIAKDFLDAGVDVLLEKPIATTIAEADDLISAAHKKNLIFQIGFVERFNPAIVALKTVMGSPVFVEAHRLHPFFERGTDVDVILDLMIHDLDIILHFAQSPLKDVQGVGVSVMSDKVDIANVRLTFESGCVANITASRVTAKTMQKMRFFGSEGYHAVNFGKKELVSLRRIKDADGKVSIKENPFEIIMHDSLEEEIRSFITSVRNRTTPVVSGEDGRAALELALIILERIEAAHKNLL